MKKITVLLSLALACLMGNNAKANPGDSCGNAVVLPALPVIITDSTPYQTTKWYSFVADSSSLYILLNFSPNTVQSIALYSVCGGTAMDSEVIESTLQDSLYIGASQLTVNHAYYMAITTPSCSVCNPDPTYTLKIKETNNFVAGTFLYPLDNTYNFSGCGLNYTLSSVPIHQCYEGGCATSTTGPYYFNISGIPPGANIYKAYVIWVVRGLGGQAPNTQTFTLTPPAGNNNGPLAGSGSVKLDPPYGNIGEPAGPPYATCWDGSSITAYSNYFQQFYANSTDGYLSDVTSYIESLKQPNGQYQIAGLPYFNYPTGSPDADGATLLIIYQDPCGAYTGYFNMLTGPYYVSGGNDILNPGVDESLIDEERWPGAIYQYRMSFPAAPFTASNESAFMMLGDLQNCDYDKWGINTGNPTNLFNGQNAAAMWNTIKQNVVYSTFQSYVYFSVDNAAPTESDCFDMVAMGSYYQVPKNTVCDKLSVSPSSYILCGNSPKGVTLNVSANTASVPIEGLNYRWQPATSLNTTTGSSVVVTPTVTTTYTVTGYDINGDPIPCLTTTVTVTVPVITITGPQTICSVPCRNCQNDNGSGGYYLSYTVSSVTGYPCGSNLNGFTYSWSNNSTSGQLSTFTPHNKTYTIFVPQSDAIDLENGFTVTVTVCCPPYEADGFCCSENYQVNGCCIQPCPSMVDPVFSGNPSDKNTLNLNQINTGWGRSIGQPNNPLELGFNYVVDSNNTWIIEDANSNTLNCGYLIINGLVSVNQNLLIRNSDINMGPNAKFVLAPGVTMTVDNSHIHAAQCGPVMWNGIYVPHNAEVDVNNGSLIEDAKEAIVSEDGGKYNIFESTLNKNRISIYAEPYNGTHPGVITASQIACNNLKSPEPPYNSMNNVTLDGPVTLIAPYSGQRSSMGMLIDSVRAITIGNNASATPSNINTFENQDYGINSNASSITVVHNDFNDTYPTVASGVPGIAGIYAKGDPAGMESAFIGTPYPNTFEGWTLGFGVWVRDTMNAYIDNNTFSNNFVGVNVTSTFRKIILIGSNTFSNSEVDGIYCYANLLSDINIENNTMNNLPAYIHSTGINIENTNLAVHEPYSVHNNTLTNMGTGILFNSVYGGDIAQNTITLLNTGFLGLNEGIELDGCMGQDIDHNIITTLYTPNRQDGIWVDFGNGNMTETCNTVEYTNNGCTFDGLFAYTFFADNNMYYNNIGLLLDHNGVIGAQGNNTSLVNDNQWFGSTTWNTYCQNSANGNLSPFYVRSGSSYDPTLNNNDLTLNAQNILFAVDLNPSSAYDCSGNGNGNGNPSSAAALQIINDSVTYGGYVTAARWLHKHSLYIYLNNVDSSLLTVPAIRHFRDSAKAANMGRLNDISAALGDTNGVNSTDITMATNLSAIIAGPDTVEQTMQATENIVIAMQGAHTNIPDSAQIAQLKIIAPLCPAEYGNAVFLARAILSSVDTTRYISSCELSEADSNNNARIMHSNNTKGNNFSANVFPNPANTKLIVEIELQQGEVAHFELYNDMGQQIRNVKLKQNLTTLPLSNLAQGIYFYKITDNNMNLIKADKLTIIH